MSEEIKNYDEQSQEIPEENYYEAYQDPTPQPAAPVASNFGPGLVGAFLGALIGAILWVVIYYLGFIAGLAGAITIICALKGYEIFGKALDKKGVITCILLSIVMIFLANRISWALLLVEEFVATGYDVTIMDVFPVTEECLTQEGLAYYFKDLLIGYGLTLLASYKTIINAFKSVK